MSTQSSLPSHKRPLLSDEKPPLVAPGDLQFVLAVGFILGLRVLPASMRPRFLLHLSQRLGAAWYRSNMQDVRRVRNHLKILFPGRWEDREIETIVRQQLSLTAWNFMTLNLIPTLSREQSAQLLPVEGMAHLDALRNEGRATLLLGAHVGPYAYPVAAVLLAHDYPVREVGHARPRQGSSWLYRQLYWPRVANTVAHLQVLNTLEGQQTELLEIFREGQILYLLPDQFYILDKETPPSRHVMPVEFLGRKVNLETGGLRLAKRMGAGVLVVLPTKSQDTYCVSIEPIELPTTGLSPADLAEDLRVFMGRVEQCILERPYLWRDLRRADLMSRLGMENPA